jgi:hypothetical protein
MSIKMVLFSVLWVLVGLESLFWRFVCVSWRSWLGEGTFEEEPSFAKAEREGLSLSLLCLFLGELGQGT